MFGTVAHYRGRIMFQLMGNRKPKRKLLRGFSCVRNYRTADPRILAKAYFKAWQLFERNGSCTL
jgi:hypothetical protein